MLTTAPTPEQPGRWVISKFGPPSVLQWQSLSKGLGPLNPDHVRLRVLVAGIGGADNLQRIGGHLDERCRKPGFTPGYDVVGEIVEVGRAVSSWSVGDRVVSLCVVGGYATHIDLPSSEITNFGDVADDTDLLKICAIPLNYMTAWGMLKRSGVELQPGSSILIRCAAGGIGTAIAQLVESFDMGIQMIGTSSRSKMDYVRSLGVEHVDHNTQDLWKAVRSLTKDGKGVDVALDSVGSYESLEQSYKATKDGVGRLIMFGRQGHMLRDGSGMDADASVADLARHQHFERMTLWSTDRHYYFTRRELWQEDFVSILELVRRGKLAPRISELFRLNDAVRANEKLVSGDGVQGKMLFVVDKTLADRVGLP